MSNRYISFKDISASYETAIVRSWFELTGAVPDPLIRPFLPYLLRASVMSALAFSSSSIPIAASGQCMRSFPARDID